MGGPASRLVLLADAAVQGSDADVV